MNDTLNSSAPQNMWARGNAYESFMGRWSRLIAGEFLNWLALPSRRDWLDIGCGTGALSQTILQVTAPRRVKGIDASTGFITHAQEQVQDQRAHFEVGDAQALVDQTATYDAVVSGLMLNFIHQPIQALSEMKRVVRSGGIVAAYVWDYAGKMQFLRHFWNAAAALDPNAFDLDEGRRFPLCQPTQLIELFQSAELEDIEVLPIDIPTDFRNFDDYWSPFLGDQGPAPSYTMSLSEGRRAALRERIRAALPYALDGSIPLVARAWAVQGVRPS